MKTKPIIENRKARHNFDIIEEYETGLVLEGWEVKAIINHSASIIGAYCKVINDEVFLIGALLGKLPDDISRNRKLLLHRKEIAKLIGKTAEKGLSLIPLRLYSSGNKYKLLIGVGRGKKLHDKRVSEKDKSINKDLNILLKHNISKSWILSLRRKKE